MPRACGELRLQFRARPGSTGAPTGTFVRGCFERPTKVEMVCAYKQECMAFAPARADYFPVICSFCEKGRDFDDERCCCERPQGRIGYAKPRRDSGISARHACRRRSQRQRCGRFGGDFGFSSTTTEGPSGTRFGKPHGGIAKVRNSGANPSKFMTGYGWIDLIPPGRPWQWCIWSRRWPGTSTPPSTVFLASDAASVRGHPMLGSVRFRHPSTESDAINDND